MSISNLNGGSFGNFGMIATGQLGAGYSTILFKNGNGSFDITYNGLKHWSYKDQDITKITYRVTVSPNRLNGHANGADYLQDNGKNPVYTVQVSKDPTRGLELLGVTANIQIKFYYANGNQVEFTPNTAYFAVGSLDNYQNLLKTYWKDSGGMLTADGYSIEMTKVNSGGKALGLSSSSVTPHGSVLYADNPNYWRNVADGTIAGDGEVLYYTKNGKHYTGPFGNDNNPMSGGSWDSPNNADAYFGAGLINLNGNELDVTAGTFSNDIPDGATYRNWLWWNMSTIIPKTPTEKLHYHYDVFGICGKHEQ